MSKKNWSNILSVLARTALAFVFVFGQTAWATQGQNGKDKPITNAATKLAQAPTNPLTEAVAKAKPPQEESASTENSSSPGGNLQRGTQHEGIKVHGHWTIEVRDSDGTLVTHREFENSLQAGGAALGAVLSRQYVPGTWVVSLISHSGGLCFVSGQDGECDIGENSLAGLPNVTTGLTVGTVGGGTSAVTGVSLNGSTNVPSAGSILEVSTLLFLCPSTMTPSACYNLGNKNGSGGAPAGLQFTLATLTNPVNISAGQTVAVTVNITFS